MRELRVSAAARAGALVILLGALSCASALLLLPPPPPPGPAIEVTSFRFTQAAMDRVRFECGKGHAGVELRIALLDARGREMEQIEVRAGRVFGGAALTRGRVIRRRVARRKEARLKVVGRARPTAALRSRRIDAVELASVKLLSGSSCARDEDGHLMCDALKDPRVASSLRLERVADPGAG